MTRVLRIPCHSDALRMETCVPRRRQERSDPPGQRLQEEIFDAVAQEPEEICEESL